MGAHAAPLVRAPTKTLTLTTTTTLFFFFFFLFLSSSCTTTLAEGGAGGDAVALLNFRGGLSNADALESWNNATTPCSGNYGNWIGVLCVDGNIWGLQLEHMALAGEIDVDSLLLLPHLRTLSFMNNKFDGPFPSFNKLGSLKSLYVSNNQFSGQLADDTFAGMRSLKKLYLAYNKLSGGIPKSLAHLPKLLEVRLEGNQFDGVIPNFQQKNLKIVDVSNNQLEGPIPPTLSNLLQTSFLGNKDLCGKPLDSVCKPSEVSPDNAKKASPLNIVIIVICCGIAIAAILAILVIFCRSKSQTPQLGRAGSSAYNKKHTAGVAGAASLHVQQQQNPASVEMNRGNSVSKKAAAAEHGKLSFVREDRLRFDLQDLLRASAEVLGSGNFGSSYKAVLMEGQAVVVKRFKQMNNVGREEFHEHMRRLGRLSHPNLLPLVAYYYRKEEKLLVFDYVHNRSLASHLHGNHSAEHPGLDWPTRLKIVKGVARGLTYLYNELPSLIVPHGHLKSSNVLLDESFEPLLMDYTLVPVVNPEHAQQILVAYKSPEYTQNARTTKKTDVWSLGILILEILTGKFPAINLAQGKGNSTVNLANWVDSIASEDADKVFDEEMGCAKNDEMLKLLKIGVDCCEEDVEKRMDLKEVVDKLEELKERDSTSDVMDV